MFLLVPSQPHLRVQDQGHETARPAGALPTPPGDEAPAASRRAPCPPGASSVPARCRRLAPLLATPAGPSLLRFRESSSPSALRPLSRQLPHPPPCPPSSPCLDGGGGVRRVCRVLSVDAGSVSLVCTLEPPKGLRSGLHPERGILCVCGGLPGGSGERPG